MGKKKQGGGDGGGASKGPDDDDLLLDAAVAENRALQEKAAKEAAVSAEDAASAALNKLPVFAIANSEKKPLTFKLSLGDQMAAIFYADVESAKAQLATTKKSSPDLGCDLITVGLGTAFRLASAGKAIIVPDAAELTAAGAPAGIQPMGIELPLFGCMKMVGAVEGGGERPVLPLYMSHAECAAAVAEAQAACPAGTPPLEITTVGLESLYAQLTDPGFDKTFKLVAPAASLQHCESYLGNGVFMRRVEDPDDAVPPLA